MKRMFVVLISVLLLVSLVSGCIGSGGSEGIKEKIKEKVEMSKPRILSISHRWGEINDRYSEIITEIVVYNPNPVSVPLKNISVHLYMNGIDMGEGHNIGPASLAAKSNTTIILSTKIDNYKIPKWWVSHLKNGEVTEVLLKGKLVFDLKVFDFSWPFEQKSVIKTNIVDNLAFTNMVLSKRISIPLVGNFDFRLLMNMSSRWGQVTEDSTEIIHDVTIYNPQKFITVPITNIGYEILINDIMIGEGVSKQKIVLYPRSTGSLQFVSNINNQALVEWWVSHIKNNEQSTFELRLYFVFDLGGQEIKIPLPEGTIKTEIKTNILGS